MTIHPGKPITNQRDRRAYRADIDGLRAVSVIAVVLYHFSVWPFTGGFVGVDVFFVISGYLITSIIYQEVSAGTFSFLDFYDRRIRRILPALLAVTALSLILGWQLLLPDDYAALGSQASTAVLGVSNFYFLWTSGYFARDAEMLPLLHTWSLAVEEQFYLFWPIVLLMVWRLTPFGRSVAIFLSTLILASFLWAINTVANEPEVAFFMLHTRAWELALGAILVFLPKFQHRIFSEVAAGAGLALILYACLTLSADDPFPGANALYPCIGAMLVIWPKSRETAAAKLLSVRPAVFIGLISYSLYLWHWPVLVFFKHFAKEEPTAWQVFALLAASLLLAMLSWRLVEQPFRRRTLHSRQVVKAGIAGIAVMAGLSQTISAQSGFPNRLDKKAAYYASFSDRGTNQVNVKNCFSHTKKNNNGKIANKCIRLDSYRANVLLMGDSHSQHFHNALSSTFPDVNFVSLTSSGCRPVLRPTARDDSRGRACRDTTIDIFDHLIPKHRFDAVILSARWKNGQADQVSDTVRYLKKHIDRVIVFGQTIEYKSALPKLLIAQLSKPDPISNIARYHQMKKIDTLLLDEARSSGAEYYSIIDILCPNGADSCRTLTPSGAPFSWDYGHFTQEGAEAVISDLIKRGLTLKRVTG